MKRLLPLLFLASTLLHALGDPAGHVKKVLFYSKAASWEQKIIHRDGDQLSYLEKVLQKLGEENQIEFTFTKDGTVFTPENLAKFDAFFFFTSGDMTSEGRNGRGDNYPLMTLEGKKAFLDAISNGKGFIGCNTANYTFIEPVSPGEKNNQTNAWRYTRMIGSGYMGHNDIQKGYFSYLDHKFPGMDQVPDDYSPVDQWYAFNRLMPDIHVVMALDAGKLKGNLYERPSYPIAWTRMEGKGRVFYTTMGHSAEIWKDPIFLRMLLGGIRWSTGLVDADVTPDIATATPHASDIPQGASKYIAGEPPGDNPHFPGYKVHIKFDPAREPHAEGLKHILFFTKSAGYQHPIVYRDGSSPSFLEREMLEFGRTNNIDFVISKDGTIFSPENIAKFDAFIFYTTGDLTTQPRNGPGDNYLLMPPEGKEAFLQAIRVGKGFIGLHSAIDTFTDSSDVSKLDSYGKMLGAECLGNSAVQTGHLIQVDKTFPGMENVPADFTSSEEWYSLKGFAPDLHVILSLDGSHLTGALRGRPNYPVAWARMEGKGRVYYTSLGHSEETWKNPFFRQMFLGAIRWTTGQADAGITPNLDHTIAKNIPEPAQSVVAK
jgi:type 1 glutamine amidotransferase